MHAEFAPELSSPRPQPRRPIFTNHTGGGLVPTSPYEAASYSSRTVGWQPVALSSNDAILGSLGTLRARSRAAGRNNGTAISILDEWVSNVIGDGITPMSQAPAIPVRDRYGVERPLPEVLDEEFTRWTDYSDADGNTDFYGQQALGCLGWAEAGEMFGRFRQRLVTDMPVVPVQLQLIEPELCPHTYTTVAANGANVRAGIEFGGPGRRTAYYFHPSRPEIDDYDRSELRRVPSDAVIHMYQMRRTGQLRGIPRTTQALIKLWELAKYDDATLLRQQIQNFFMAFLRKSRSNQLDTISPVSGKTKAPAARPLLTMEPGTIQELEPDEDMVFSNPAGAGAGYAEFWRAQLRIACNAAGVPYELVTGDMSSMNDRTVRVLLNQFKRRVGMVQHQVVVYQFCRPTWRAWMNRGFVTGTLPLPADYATNPERYQAVTWTPPRWAYLHPVQDVEADTKAIAAGLTSRKRVLGAYGESAEVIDREQAEDNARADRAGLTYTSDPRVAAKSGSSPAPAPELEPDGNQPPQGEQ